jgi:hypothetical protein
MSYEERTKHQQAVRTAAEAANERESARHLDDDLRSLGHPPVALANLGHGRLSLAEASALGEFVAVAAERAGLLDDLRAVLLAAARLDRNGRVLALFGVTATMAGEPARSPDGAGMDWRSALAQRDGSPVPALRDPHATAEELARRMVRRLADDTPEDGE